ncbi:MAG TPA: ribose 5-phosphate isomerase B [Ignavibacteria bacterium]|jgi:ribose 5-phosphate isomerase B
MKNIVIGADHRGYPLKEKIKQILSNTYKITDVGTTSTESVDYPDIARDVVKKILSGECEKGVLICGSGVGACVAANKFKGIRAAICHDLFSAHQGVEDDDMNMICLGSGVVGESLAVEIISTFVNARFKSEEERYVRRLKKIKKIEDENVK